MKLREIHQGESFVLNGMQFIYERTEGDAVTLRLKKTGRVTVYGFRALNVILHQFGMEIVKEEIK